MTDSRVSTMLGLRDALTVNSASDFMLKYRCVTSQRKRCQMRHLAKSGSHTSRKGSTVFAVDDEEQRQIAK